MIDNFVSEIRLIVENYGNVILIGDVLRSDNRELVPGYVAVRTACGAGSPRGHPERGGGCGRLIERNIFDASTRDGTAHRDAMQHVVEFQVIDVERLAGNFLPAFFAGNGFADESHWIQRYSVFDHSLKSILL